MASQTSEEFIYNDIRRKLHDNAKKDYNQEMIDFLKSKDWQHCEYCKTKLLSKYETNYPWQKVPSIDHKIPRVCGGSNEYDNMAIVCCRCNLVKGTMNYDTYLIFIKAITEEGEEIKERILNEFFIGRKANKLQRMEKEKCDGYGNSID